MAVHARDTDLGVLGDATGLDGSVRGGAQVPHLDGAARVARQDLRLRREGGRVQRAAVRICASADRANTKPLVINRSKRHIDQLELFHTMKSFIQIRSTTKNQNRKKRCTANKINEPI